MRIVSGLTVLALMLHGTAALAQSAVEGPLAAPGATAKPSKAKSHYATRRAPSKDAAANIDPTAAPLPAPSSRAVPQANPIDFGMKWNGSSDNARDTRVQNYDGNAAGTGAEVGMKLHF